MSTYLLLIDGHDLGSAPTCHQGERKTRNVGTWTIEAGQLVEMMMNVPEEVTSKGRGKRRWK